MYFKFWSILKSWVFSLYINITSPCIKPHKTHKFEIWLL
jgi:hypothetical protein